MMYNNNMKILITSGGTKIPIDRVRSIMNMSRGTSDSRIADTFYKKIKDWTEDVLITFFMAKGLKTPIVQHIDNEYLNAGQDYHEICRIIPRLTSIKSALKSSSRKRSSTLL